MGASLDEIKAVKQQLAETFKMTNMGDSNYYLGMDLHYDRANEILHLDQSKYVEQIIKLYGYQDLKPAPILMRIDANFTKETNH